MKEQDFKDQLKGEFSSEEISYFLRCITEDMLVTETLSVKEWEAIVIRLNDDEPIQYITGLAPFYGYFFNVDSSVLIPRPETEELVFNISTIIKNQKLKTPKILEIGSGSGCIPITLGLLHPRAEILSVDVSDRAISIAESNNEKHNTNIKFRHIDFLQNENWATLRAQYDIIVSNPPYIPEKEKELMAANVLDHEPHVALFVEDNDPLIFYRHIYEFAKSNLARDGHVFLECNEYNAMDVKLLYADDFDAEIIVDMQGKDRMVKARVMNN